jgi:hypothetical protein
VIEPVLAETPGSRIRLAGERRRESAGPFGDAPEGEEGVERDNESVDDTAFIEETQDTDVAEIIGDETEPDD